MPGSSKWSSSLRFPHQNLYAFLLSPIRATCNTELQGERHRNTSNKQIHCWRCRYSERKTFKLLCMF
jgi:hypothetical protein